MNVFVLLNQSEQHRLSISEALKNEHNVLLNAGMNIHNIKDIKTCALTLWDDRNRTCYTELVTSSILSFSLSLMLLCLLTIKGQMLS